MLFQTSLGIDIADQSVSIVYLKGSFKGVRLAAQAVYPLERETSPKERMDQIGQLIRHFQDENRVSPAALFLGMPRHDAILRYVQLPLAVKENLEKSIEYEMEKYIPLPAESIYFDAQVVSEDKDSGRLRLLLVGARREAIDPYLDLAAQIGVKISGIEPASTALVNYFADREGPDLANSCAIVSLRDGHLELSGMKDSFLEYSRSVDQEEWGPDLQGFIAHELEKRKAAHNGDEEPLPVVFLGFDEQPGIIDHLQSDERLDIRQVDFSRTRIASAAVIPAYGLALKGIRDLETDINLAPKDRRRRPNKAGQYTMMALAGLIVLLALVWGGGNIISQQLHLGRLNAEIERLSVQVDRIQKIRSQCDAMEAQIDYLGRLFGAGAPVLEILKELSGRIPESAWVTSFSFSDGEVKLDGRADASSELIPSLEASPLFADVAFISSITRGQTGKETFRIGLKVTK